MSINKLISIKTPILDALDLLQIDHMQHIPIFTRWASLAEKDIDSYFQYQRKVCTVKVEGHVAKLPGDATDLQRCVKGDATQYVDLTSNLLCGHLNLGTISSYGTFLVIDAGSDYTGILGSVPCVVQDNKLIFNQNFDGQIFTIQYLGYACDDEGFLKISQNHVQAIMWNIVWKYYYGKKKKSPLEYGEMNAAKAEWNRECANSRARDGKISESEQAEMVGMLWDPYIGQGLSVGMHSTQGNYNSW